MHWTVLTLNILYSAIGTLLICAAGVLLGWWLWHLLRVKTHRGHTLTLENKGNCRCIYYLEVKSPEPALGFSLLYNGLALGAVYLPEEEEASSDIVAVTEPSTSAGPTKSASAPAPATETFTKTGEAAAGASGKAASFLEMIGELLPGSLGKNIKEQSATFRGIQTKTSRVARTPQKVRRQARGFQHLSGGKKTPGPRGENLSSPRSDQTGITKEAGEAEEFYFVQSPMLEPGQAIQLELSIEPHRRQRLDGTYPYTVTSLPSAVDYPRLETKPCSQNGMVHFPKVAAWRYSLRVLTEVALGLIAMAAIVLIYRFIWL